MKFVTRTKGHTVIVSLRSRERGLKSLSPCSFSDSYRVAPFAGAWIEIQPYLGRQKFGTVAPFAGAWIEILQLDNGIKTAKSLPSRERGLKYLGILKNHSYCRRSLRGSVD